ncbi:MAG: NAD(P)/FAD-dependent oxidoreductase [Chloroflexota bacterium]
MNRRAFLKIMTATLAAQALPGCQGNPPANGQRILILGAGIAGLAAAATLRQQGYETLLIEARDRIGGRIWTSNQWDDAPLDLGASWIHGLRGNPIADIAAEAQARLVTTDNESAITYHSNGRPLSEAQTEQLEDLTAQLWQAIIAAQEDDPDRSVQEVVAAALAASPPDAERQQWANFILNSYVEHEYAGSSAAQSVHWFDDGDEFGGDDALFRDGYQVITQHLAQGLPLVLQQPARRVQWDDTQVTVYTESAAYSGERLIITLPLGVLQAGHVTFAPALPTAKQQAIAALGMGVLNKCYLRFAELFWPAEFDWLEYIPTQHGQWAEWVSLARPTGLPILLGFNAADFGREIEAWSDTAVVASAMQTLRHLFGSHIPEPLDYQITRWAADPYSYGSYSFNALGATPSMRDDLAQSVAQRLFFAGEATERSYFGTVHGAYLSGLRAAQEVMAASE